MRLGEVWPRLLGTRWSVDRGIPVKLVILHQLPVELYPPVINWLRTISTHPGIAAAVITSPNQRSVITADLPGVSFIRLPFANASQIAPLRWLLFLFWHMRAALQLYRWRPDAVLSVEPHSALAAWIWKVLLRGRGMLLIHHHEYYSPSDYLSRGNRLIRINRLFENRLLRKADWVSQTNSDRMNLFRQDHPDLTDSQCRVLPNYPPRAWFQQQPKTAPWPKSPEGPLRLVYVGSVSLKDTWIGPLVEWLVCSSNRTCTLSVYSSNIDDATRRFLEERQGGPVTLHAEGVEYDMLPKVLSQYDVGLILYRCRTLNFVYNATNKLFEYLVCGLDVWYPPCMLGVKSFACSNAAPRIIETNFEQMNLVDMNSRKSRNCQTKNIWEMSCEDEVDAVLKLIVTPVAQKARQ
jgi:hypothetical protein